MRDRREDVAGTQYIHPITRFPSIIVIGGVSIILTTLRVTASPMAARITALLTSPPALTVRQVHAGAASREVGPERGDIGRRSPHVQGIRSTGSLSILHQNKNGRGAHPEATPPKG